MNLGGKWYEYGTKFDYSWYGRRITPTKSEIPRHIVQIFTMETRTNIVQKSLHLQINESKSKFLRTCTIKTVSKEKRKFRYDCDV